MPVKAGQIVIDVDAGTSRFVVDMERAKAKIREFGTSGVSSTRAVGAELRALEGNFTGNVRAAEAFISSFKGLGPIIQAAFPIVGAIAFAGVLGELGKKVYEFFKELRDAPEKAAHAWSAIMRPMQLANDQLDLTNAKLERDIAKLQGKPENNLAIALAEAKVQADQLGNSLGHDLEQITKLLTEQTPGLFSQLFTGFTSGNFRLGNNAIDDLKTVVGGKSGVGGALAKNDKLADAENDELDALKGQKLSSAQLNRAIHAIREKYGNLMIQVDQGIIDTIEGSIKSGDLSDIQREIFERSSRAFKAQIHQIRASDLGSDLEVQKTGLEDAAANAKLTQPITDKFAELNAQREEAKGLNDVAGLGEQEQEKVKALALVTKTIQELDKALGNHKNLLTEVQRAEISASITGTADINADTKAKTQLANLNEQIEYEGRLAIAQYQGAEAIRKAELNQKLLDIQRNNSVERAKELTEAEIRLYNIKREAAAIANTTRFLDEANDQSRLGSAAFGGAAALRRAQLENEIEAMRKAGATEDEIVAKTAAEAVKHQTEINLEAGKTVTQYSDQLQKLNEIRASIIAQGGDAAALLTIDKERLEVMAQQDLASGTALGGLKAYFEKMQAEAKTTGQIVFDSLNDATNKLTDELSKTLTGQKANYKKLFQGLAADLDKELIKSQLSKGIGALGKILHIDTGTQRTPSFRPGDPGHVIVDNLGGGGASGGGTAPSGGGFGGGTFGGGSQGGGIFSLLGQGAQAGLLLSHAAAGLAGLPGLAEGGDVNPYSTYVVGENAPELFTPRSAGTITPMHKMGGQSHYYSIDARGAALGVENRIARSIESAHSSAISHSMKAMQERQRRTPQRKGDR